MLDHSDFRDRISFYIEFSATMHPSQPGEMGTGVFCLSHLRVAPHPILYPSQARLIRTGKGVDSFASTLHWFFLFIVLCLGIWINHPTKQIRQERNTSFGFIFANGDQEGRGSLDERILNKQTGRALRSYLVVMTISL